QLDLILISQCKKSIGKSFEPDIILRERLGQCQGQRYPARCCAHRCHIGKIDSKCLVPQLVRFCIRQKMSACYQCIDRNRPVHACCTGNPCSIITRPQQCVSGRASKIASDNIKLGIHGPSLYDCPRKRWNGNVQSRLFFGEYWCSSSAARSCPPSLSSTPLTYLCPSVPP